MVNSSNRYVFCLKWGTKYSSDYVNNLYNMVERHLAPPYTFICFTDNTSGIDPKIQTAPLRDKTLEGWWNKISILGNPHSMSGTALFLDLDLVICGSLEKFFSHAPGRFCIIRDFNRHVRPDLKLMNSSVFRFELGSFTQVYEEFIKNQIAFKKRYQGDQDYMTAFIKDFEFWPDEWVQSYKWEMRNKRDLTQTRTGLNFYTTADPKVLPDTSIAAFHGKPNPHECTDPWVRQHWR